MYFPIVGIGASAGGLVALEAFLSHVPPDAGIALVIVQHLDPHRNGMLVDLLQRHTAMPVAQIHDQMPIELDHVYVIPPGRDLSVLNGVLHLLEPVASGGPHLPIDFFFKSLAQDCKQNGVGVILSGMGSDGTQGLRAIKQAAGACFVQTPASAQFDGMPRSAIHAGVADVLAPAEELPLRILAYVRRAQLRAEPDALDQVSPVEAGFLEKAVILLQAQSGHDFSQYKKGTLLRRIERRMGLHQLTRSADYLRYLRESPQEAELLFNELLIGVTSFFRDPPVWAQLKAEVIPALLASNPPGAALRAWMPACSSAAVTSDDVAPLSVPRLFQTATLLLDGSVLVVGGADTVPVQTASKSADRVAVLRVPLAVEAGRSQLLGAQEVGVPGAAMHLQGRFISLLGEATGGTHSSGAQLATARWVPTAGPPQPGLLLVQSDTSADWFAPAPMVPGAGVLFAVAHGLPSRGSRVVIAGAGAGVACRVDAQCATGFCSDGVCCNEVCGEACHACSAARKGRGKDGVCEAVLAGALHHGCTVLAECPADTGFCTDQGSCATCPPPPALVVTCNDHVLEGADAGQDCSPYRCAKDPATCLGSCKSKVDCVEGYACSAAGTCLPAFADAGPAGCGVSPRLRGWTVSQIMALMGALGLAVGMRRWATGRRR